MLLRPFRLSLAALLLAAAAWCASVVLRWPVHVPEG